MARAYTKIISEDNKVYCPHCETELHHPKGRYISQCATGVPGFLNEHMMEEHGYRVIDNQHRDYRRHWYFVDADINRLYEARESGYISDATAEVIIAEARAHYQDLAPELQTALTNALKQPLTIWSE